MTKKKKPLDRTKYEKRFFDAGHEYVIGVDEVGRGAGAGPITACAFIADKRVLEELKLIEGLRDSKKVTPKRRKEIFKILTKGYQYALFHATSHEIDTYGINSCNKKIMEKAWRNLLLSINNQYPVATLIDGNLEINVSPNTRYLTRGDDRSLVIAAASIIAKETRDQNMKEFSDLYPEWSFQDNKGYLTEAHRKAIKEFGLSEIHRRSFCEKLV